VLFGARSHRLCRAATRSAARGPAVHTHLSCLTHHTLALNRMSVRDLRWKVGVGWGTMYLCLVRVAAQSPKPESNLGFDLGDGAAGAPTLHVPRYLMPALWAWGLGMESVIKSRLHSYGRRKVGIGCSAACPTRHAMIQSPDEAARSMPQAEAASHLVRGAGSAPPRDLLLVLQSCIRTSMVTAEALRSRGSLTSVGHSIHD
jgi:hypothetical protein